MLSKDHDMKHIFIRAYPDNMTVIEGGNNTLHKQGNRTEEVEWDQFIKGFKSKEKSGLDAT